MVRKTIKQLTQVIQHEPNNAKAYFDRGNAYYEKGDYEKAIEDYTQAISFEPDNADYNLHRGNAYFARASADENKASEDYARATKLQPGSIFDYIFYMHTFPSEASKNYQRGTAYLNKKTMSEL